MSALDLLNTLINELEAVSVTATAPPKKEKKEKKEKPATSSTAPSNASSVPSSSSELTINSLDFRVGIISKVDKHPTAEKLYIEEIDVGEGAPRAIASGLVPYYTLEQMLGKKLIVVCNLKPRNLVGFKSYGMVLCASVTDEEGNTKVEFVDPPVDSQPGDRIIGQDLELIEPLVPNKVDKLKAFESLAGDLKVGEDGQAFWKNSKLVSISNGQVCSAPTLRNCLIK